MSALTKDEMASIECSVPTVRHFMNLWACDWDMAYGMHRSAVRDAIAAKERAKETTAVRWGWVAETTP